MFKTIFIMNRLTSMAVLLLTFTMCIAEVTDKDVVKCRVESCGG